MGDPSKQRRKYSRPAHPWQKARIEEEKQFLKDYGLKNKEEVWKTDSLLRKFKKQAKRVIAFRTPQMEKEKTQLFSRLYSLGLIGQNAISEDILSLTAKNLLERRLQTIVYKKKLARSMRQARQFIIHKHIKVRDSLITAPSYLVSRDEEQLISYSPSSPLSKPGHPEVTMEEQPKKSSKAKEEISERRSESFEKSFSKKPAKKKEAGEKPKKEKKDKPQEAEK